MATDVLRVFPQLIPFIEYTYMKKNYLLLISTGDSSSRMAISL